MYQGDFVVFGTDPEKVNSPFDTLRDLTMSQYNTSSSSRQNCHSGSFATYSLHRTVMRHDPLDLTPLESCLALILTAPVEDEDKDGSIPSLATDHSSDEEKNNALGVPWTIYSH